MKLMIWTLPDSISSRQFDQFANVIDKSMQQDAACVNLVVTHPHKVDEYDITNDDYLSVCVRGLDKGDYEELIRRLQWSLKNFFEELKNEEAF